MRFAFWFRRLVYTQIWEDPEADLAALRLPVGSTIVTISSGGCNALSYLTAQPAQVYAVDLNEAHLSLLKLKLAGLRACSNYAEFWQFFGEAASPSRPTYTSNPEFVIVPVFAFRPANELTKSVLPSGENWT